MTAVETALERELATHIMRGGAKPTIRKFAAGDVLTEQGAAGDELFLLLDGVLEVEVDGDADRESVRARSWASGRSSRAERGRRRCGR